MWVYCSEKMFLRAHICPAGRIGGGRMCLLGGPRRTSRWRLRADKQNATANNHLRNATAKNHQRPPCPGSLRGGLH